jgi:hypothetical protein
MFDSVVDRGELFCLTKGILSSEIFPAIVRCGLFFVVGIKYESSLSDGGIYV